MMLRIPVNSGQEDMDNSLDIFRGRITVVDGPHRVINKCEDLEVDHADELT